MFCKHYIYICNITYIFQISLSATPVLQISLLTVSLFHSLYLNDYLISQTARHNFPGDRALGGGNPRLPLSPDLPPTFQII